MTSSIPATIFALLTLCALTACNTPSALAPDCDTDSIECSFCDPTSDTNTCKLGHVCDPDLSVCVLDDAQLPSCDPDREDPRCPVAHACDAELELCVPRPFTIGVTLNLDHADPVRRQFDNYYHHVIFDYMWSGKLARWFPEAQSPVEIRVLDPGDTSSQYKEMLGPQIDSSLDAIITLRSSEYQAVAELLDEKDLSILTFGRYARRLDQYTAEQCQLLAGTSPANDERFAFSIAPFQDNLAASKITYVRDTMKCSKFAFMYDSTNNADKLSNALLEKWADLLGVDYVGAGLTVLDRAEFKNILSDLEREGVDCIDYNTNAGLDVDAFITDAEDDGELDFQWILLERTFYDESADFAELQPLLEDSAVRDKVHFYRLDIDDESKLENVYPAFLDAYEVTHELECSVLDAGSECDLPHPDEIATIPSQFALSTDLITMLALTYYRAWNRREYDLLKFSNAPLSQEDLRDTFLRILFIPEDADATYGYCDHLDIDECFKRIDNGLEAHFTGLSSSMFLGVDGRMTSMYEKTLFTRAKSSTELDAATQTVTSSSQMLRIVERALEDASAGLVEPSLSCE